MFFSVDRFASFRTEWREDYLSGVTILSDRYTTANAVHQGSKLPEGELDGFLDWLFDFEYNKLELPAPDLVVYMDIDVETATARLSERQRQMGESGDIHETDTDYLRRCTVAGRRAAERFGWLIIDSLAEGVPRSVEDIHEEIYRNISL